MITEETFFGGAQSRSITTDIVLFRTSGRVQLFNPSSNFLKINLPQATKMKLGGPWFYIFNRSASFTLSIRDFLDTEILQLPPEKASMFSLVSRTSLGGAWFFDQPRDWASDLGVVAT